MEFFGNIKNGKVSVESKQALDYYISNLKEGDDLIINLQLVSEVKSLRQLRLAYLCFRKISEHTGYSVNESKMLAKMHQGLCSEATIEVKNIFFCKSLSEMSKKELSDFIMKMDNWAAKDLSINLLEFEDVKFLKNT